MFKTGIYSLEQLSGRTESGRSWKNKLIAIDLYNEIGRSGLADKEKIEEAIMRHFCSADGSLRQTYDYRFEEFDAEALKQIKKIFSAENLLRLHDVAVSDGRTAADFFEKLKRSFKKVSYHATDKDIFIKIKSSLECPRNRIAEDEAGNILQIVYPPFVINPPLRENLFFHPINRWLSFRLKNKKIRDKRLKLDAFKEERISVFSRKALKLERDEPGFSLGAYDLANPMPEKYDIIRAMNILGKNSFSGKEAEKIISNLKDGLKDIGLLLIGANKKAGSPVNGNIFLKKNGVFTVLSAFGDETPYKELFLKN